MNKVSYIYLTIPKEWEDIYHKLLAILSFAGKNIIDDCTYSCKGNGKNIFNCWNLFQSAIAAKRLGEDKKANLFIEYITSQIELLYHTLDGKNFDNKLPSISEVLIKDELSKEELINDMKENAIYKIPSGNSFDIHNMLQYQAISFGTRSLVDIDIEKIADLSVSLVGFESEEIPLKTSIGENTNELIISVPNNLPENVYSLKYNGNYLGNLFNWKEDNVVEIISENKSSIIPIGKVSGRVPDLYVSSYWIELNTSGKIFVESISEIIGFPINNEVTFNSTFKLSTTVTPKQAYSTKILWSSTDEEIATINNDGVVSVKQTEGTVKFIATTEAVTAEGKHLSSETTTLSVVANKSTVTFIGGNYTIKNVSTNSTFDGRIITGTAGATVIVTIEPNDGYSIIGGKTQYTITFPTTGNIDKFVGTAKTNITVSHDGEATYSGKNYATYGDKYVDTLVPIDTYGIKSIDVFDDITKAAVFSKANPNENKEAAMSISFDATATSGRMVIRTNVDKFTYIGCSATNEYNLVKLSELTTKVLGALNDNGTYELRNHYVTEDAPYFWIVSPRKLKFQDPTFMQDVTKSYGEVKYNDMYYYHLDVELSSTSPININILKVD